MIYVGTSGWFYPHWQGNFYPKNLEEKDWLKYYCQVFNTVEINTTFYRYIKPEILENWRKTTGLSFTFSFKANKLITHLRRLEKAKESLSKFLGSISFKRKAKEVILFQLAPDFHYHQTRLENFLKLLPLNQRYAFEFRDKSWLNQKVYQLLKKFRVCLVIQDSAYWPSEEVLTTDFVYLRLHGKSHVYASSYSDSELDCWAQKMRQWTKLNKDIYCYFNNDFMGYAPQNAKKLMEILKK